MRKVKWSEIDIEDELRRLEALLSTSLYMNFDDETEYSVAMDLISMDSPIQYSPTLHVTAVEL